MNLILTCILLAMLREPKIIPAAEKANANKFFEQNGFVAFSTYSRNFDELYKRLMKQNEPIYVTVDPLLHGVHLLYDYTLRFAESNYFCEDLNFILKRLRIRFRDLKMVKNLQISQAARTNLAYIDVALCLLNADHKPDPDVEKIVRSEIKLIESHEGFDTSRVLNVVEDYSQYVPRGHYTRSDRLRNYFRTMMWLGRMPFYISPGDEQTQARNIFLARCAILMAKALSEDSIALSRYERIYSATSYLVGKSDDLILPEIMPLINKYFPNFFGDFVTDEKVIKFMKEASTLKKPYIFSTYFEDIDLPEKKLVSCKFMSQRFVPDSYIFQNLVYSKVGTRSRPRLFPKGLDILAVLGNQRAKDLLINFYDEKSYKGYETMLDSLRKEFSKITIKQWRQNAYWHWLLIVKSMNEPIRFPQSFKVNSSVYADKLMVTQQGFWAELRHDTILYAKQSYTAKVTAAFPELALEDVKVEPLSETYKEIITFLEAFEHNLGELGLLQPEIETKISVLKDFTTAALQASEIQKKDAQIPLEIRKILYSYGDFLENLYSFPAEFEQNQTDSLLPLVADVHTDVNTKQVLQVAVGRPMEIWIRADGKIYKGAMYSYYEFKQPMDKRLTDEEWQSMKILPPFEKWMTFITE